MILSEKYLLYYVKTEMCHSLNECVDSIKQFSLDEEYDIFISHSNLDKQLVCALYDLFTRHGFHVYLDYEDSELNPDTVSSKTGIILRERLKKCKCLAYVATISTTVSRWCPWELGLFDGISDGLCCVLPVLPNENQKTYKGNEYLGMYPYLSYDQKESGGMMFCVNDPNNFGCYISLEDWIKGEELRIHI